MRQDYPGFNSEIDVHKLYFEFAIGSSGAVGTVTRSRGLGTPVHNTTGDYTIPLEVPVQAIVESRIYLIYATVAIGNAQIVRIKTEDPTSTVQGVRFETWTQGVPSTATDGAITDPASGATIKGYIAVKYSNA